MYKPSDGAVCFTEIISKDPEATKKFLSKVLGWKFERRPGQGPEIWLFEAGNGPGGHMMAPMGENVPGTVNYIKVKSVTTTLGKVSRNGGKILVPKFRIPGAGWFAMFEAPGGVRQAIYQVPK